MPLRVVCVVVAALALLACNIEVALACDGDVLKTGEPHAGSIEYVVQRHVT
jgi:hypothetical protein